MTRRGSARLLVAVVVAGLVVAAGIAVAVNDGGDERVAAGSPPAPRRTDAATSIRAATRVLFLPGYSAREKVEQIDHGDDLEAFIADGFDDPRAAVLTLDVTAVDVDEDTAIAHIDFSLNGSPAMTDATLAFTRVGDHWRAVRASYCALRATSSPPCPAAPPSVTASGDLVRGAAVTLTVGGLDPWQGREVDLMVETDGPVATSGGHRPGYWGFGSTAVVDGRGRAVVAGTVPNALSGEDDSIPLEPGVGYLLTISDRDPAPPSSLTVPFHVVAARRGTPYPVSVGRGAVECGAPPVLIAFDGRTWVPDDADHFPADRETVDGTFVLVSDRAGRFTAADGTVTDFTQSAPSGAC